MNKKNRTYNFHFRIIPTEENPFTYEDLKNKIKDKKIRLKDLDQDVYIKDIEPKLKPPTPETGIQKYSSSLLIFVLFIIVVGLFMKKR